MDTIQAADLAKKHSLYIEDWLDITDVGIGQFGAYRVDDSGVYFHPNERSDEHGWSTKQIQDTGPAYEVDRDSKSMTLRESRAATQKRMRQENKVCIHFPCTPRQLLEFVNRDVSGDLFGLLPKVFISAVNNGPEPRDDRSDASLGAARRRQVSDFAQRARDNDDERHGEYQRWADSANEIDSLKTRSTSAREMGKLVREKLNLVDTVETIRKRITKESSSGCWVVKAG